MELKIKELYHRATSRCIDEHEEADGVCPCCGKKQNMSFILQEHINKMNLNKNLLGFFYVF